jgi:pyridoxal phosphate enzyme (YggS family)
MGTIAQNLDAVKKRIGSATRRAGRDESSVKLVAVSKTKSAEEVAEAVAAGQRIFGENYAQELNEKYEQLKTSRESRVTSNDIEWHFIGHLQKNKAKIVAPIASWIETIDSLEIADAIDRRATRQISCLIEVNIGGEETKSGMAEADVPTVIRGFGDFKNLRLKGLMIIPPYDPDPEFGRPYFKKIKSMLSELNSMKLTQEPLTELSMGMSHDFEVAIEEGATIIRVGTAIFGTRR